ncbi:MAG: hypothetical protein WAO19_02870 [Candidatus Kryptoniota bacterium]
MPKATLPEGSDRNDGLFLYLSPFHQGEKTFASSFPNVRIGNPEQINKWIPANDLRERHNLFGKVKGGNLSFGGTAVRIAASPVLFFPYHHSTFSLCVSAP